MRQNKLRRAERQRLPLTITLDPATYRFVEECAQLKQFRSIDEFFEAVLANYRQHVRAVDAYLELEAAKGHSFEDVMSAAQCEIVFTRRVESTARRSEKKELDPRRFHAPRLLQLLRSLEVRVRKSLMPEGERARVHTDLVRAGSERRESRLPFAPSTIRTKEIWEGAWPL